MTDFVKIEADMCQSLRKKYRLNIEKANFSTAFIPNYILLDSTRNIHSYLEFCKIENGNLVSFHWDVNQQLYGVLSMLQTQYSQLDRPLFFVFEGSDGLARIIESSLVREHLLEERDENITCFMLANADLFQDVFQIIHKEL